MAEKIDMTNVLVAMNKIYAEVVGDSSANYRYYQDKKKNRYFHTTRKINHKGKPRYVAGIYRYLKTKQQWILRKKVGFAKKRMAIAWAYKHCEKAKVNK